MYHTRPANGSPLLALFFLIQLPLAARPIQGTSVMRLTSPVTKAIGAQARRIAADSLRYELYFWLKEDPQTYLDTSNEIHQYHFGALHDSCVKHAAKKTRFEGRQWTLTLTVSQETLGDIINRYAATSTRRYERNLTIARQAIAEGRIVPAITAGAKTLFHRIGILNAPDNISRTADTLRTQLGKLIDRVSINAPQRVIQGKPGRKPTRVPDISVYIDTLPLAAFPLRAISQYGDTFFSAMSTDDGSVPFDNMKIPFVANGSFLYVRPDYAAMLEVPIEPQTAAFGIAVTRAPEQMLIFKISSPVYTLQYSVNSVSDLEIPADFANKSYLESFLQDSCFLKKRTGQELSDLVIEIQCQVSRYAQDAAEKTVLKVEARMVIQPLQTSDARIEKHFVVHRQEYEFGPAVTYGLFFWESASQLKQLLKKEIQSL
ncbi:MAG: hypothetical protein GF398_12810 [Chitinivibrionales bacterium]|nr:hypothetical protein [Chitinivibrionales bacterium]